MLYRNLFLNLLLSFIPFCLFAQYTPSYVGKDATEKYPYLLPIGAQKIVKLGNDLPLPVGLMFNYVHQKTEVNTTDLMLSFEEFGTYQDFSWVEFDKARNTTNVMNIRLDAWLFPFLNIYGIYAHSWTDANTQVTFPVDIPIHTEPTANTVGFGGVLAYGFKHYYMALNFNRSYTYSSALTSTIKGNIASFRLGRNFNITGLHKIGLNIGCQYQNFNSYSKGSIDMSKALGFIDTPEVHEVVDQIKTGAAEFYNNLSKPQQVIVDRFIEGLQDKIPDPENYPSTLYYTFNKERVGDWAFLVGVQYLYSKRMWFRVDYGAGNGYRNLQFTFNYRFAHKLLSHNK
ncbi:hypothetical protein K4L44_08930 [Halosquirtibacter laminarini]|uniref:Uncharacterized protein n=1 Tax=Halosquirtibacter laminarini TaxID=3374600 RepID=A0AC61NB26_9BACT|nr:hypothetical protein K4L44_08930 [Prolixibacteraceae bacterium]